MTDERSSQPEAEAPFVEPDEETRARLEAENGLRQFDRLVELIDAGLAKKFRLRPSQMMDWFRTRVPGVAAGSRSLAQTTSPHLRRRLPS